MILGCISIISSYFGCGFYYLLIRIIFSSNVSKERPIEVLGTIRSQPRVFHNLKTGYPSKLVNIILINKNYIQ
jgi:hypothetical protein